MQLPVNKMKKKIIMVLMFFVLFVYGCQNYNFANLDCEDKNSCTTDSFDSNTQSCKHEAKKCQQAQKCNINTGNCEALDVMDSIENAIRKKLGE